MTDKIYLNSKSHFKYFPLREEVRSLLLAKNFRKPTFVQGQALGILLQQYLVDLCVIIYSFNGSGKTLTFLIPIFNSLNPLIPSVVYKYNSVTKAQTTIQQPQAIIIVPTEALLQQVFTYLKDYRNYLQKEYGWKLKIGRIYANVCEMGHIIVALPKKTMDLFEGRVKYFLSELKWVVFDECDQIKQSQEEAFGKLLGHFSSKSNANFIVCSATGNSDPSSEYPQTKSNTLFRKYIQDRIPSKNIVQLDIISVLRQDYNDLALTGVTHYYSSDVNKDDFIRQILKVYAMKTVKNQIIIFFNTKGELAHFYQLLKQERNNFVVNSNKSVSNNISVGYIHGGCGCNKKHPGQCTQDCLYTKSQRISKLRNKDYNVMLATDIIGRGIDIRTVTLVINYSQPLKRVDNRSEISDVNYIHRVGRTGRYTDTGVALTFVKNTRLIETVVEKHKVSFSQLKSIQKLLAQAQQCYEKNAEQDIA